MSHEVNICQLLGKPGLTRYRKDTIKDNCGEQFRQDYLLPALQEHKHVTLNLNGYNRYARSWLNDVIEGLIVDEGMNPIELKERLVIKHDLLPNVVEFCNEFIEKYIRG